MSLSSIKENYNLVDHNTMGIAAKARFFAEVQSKEELTIFLGDNRFKNLPLLTIGGGSNILLIKDFNGLVILNQTKGKDVVEENEDEVLLKIGAGENWHELVTYCINNGWGGVENLSLIPGSVGAAPIQNIGAYGVELEEVFESLEAVEISTREKKTFNKKECQFAYRDSIFKNELKGKFIIVSVTIRLQKNPEINTTYRALSDKLLEKGIENPGIKEVSDAVIEIRQSKLPDPAKIGNTGSFFKNPVISVEEFEQLQKEYPEAPSYSVSDGVKVPAAWLIDQCGWKGRRIGDAGVHKLQALVIVNYGNASGEEIWKLASNIQKSVMEKFSIKLTPEVNIV